MNDDVINNNGQYKKNITELIREKLHNHSIEIK